MVQEASILLKMVVQLPPTSFKVAFSPKIIKQELDAVQTTEDYVRLHSIVTRPNRSKCHLMLQAITAKQWDLGFAQKTSFLANYAVVRGEAVMMFWFGPLL